MTYMVTPIRAVGRLYSIEAQLFGNPLPPPVRLGIRCEGTNAYNQTEMTHSTMIALNNYDRWLNEPPGICNFCSRLFAEIPEQEFYSVCCAIRIPADWGEALGFIDASGVWILLSCQTCACLPREITPPGQPLTPETTPYFFLQSLTRIVEFILNKSAPQRSLNDAFKQKDFTFGIDPTLPILRESIPEFIVNLVGLFMSRTMPRQQGRRQEIMDRLIQSAAVSPDDLQILFSRGRASFEFLQAYGHALNPETKFAIANRYQTTSATQTHLAGAESLRENAVQEQLNEWGYFGLRPTARLGNPIIGADNYIRSFHKGQVRRAQMRVSRSFGPLVPLVIPGTVSLTNLPLRGPRLLALCCQPGGQAAKVALGLSPSTQMDALLAAFVMKVVVPAFRKFLRPLKMDSFGHGFPSNSYYTDAYGNLPTVRLSLGRWCPRHVVYTLLENAAKYGFQLSIAYTLTAMKPYNVGEIAELYDENELAFARAYSDCDRILVLLEKLLNSIVDEPLIVKWIRDGMRKYVAKLDSKNWGSLHYYYSKMTELVPIALSLVPYANLPTLVVPLVTADTAMIQDPIITRHIVQSGMVALGATAASLFQVAPASAGLPILYDWSQRSPEIYALYHPYFEVRTLSQAPRVGSEVIILDLRERLVKELNLTELADILAQACEQIMQTVIPATPRKCIVLDSTRLSGQISDICLINLYKLIINRVGLKGILIGMARSNLKYRSLELDKYHCGEVWIPNGFNLIIPPLSPELVGSELPDAMWELTKKLQFVTSYAAP